MTERGNSHGTGKVRKERVLGSMNMNSKKPIIHPIFEKAMGFTDDHFWKYKFYMAARGKMPSPEFSYNNGILIRKGKTKSVPYNIPEDPEEATETFIKIMHKAGIKSDSDIRFERLKREYEENSRKVELPSSWSKVPLKQRQSYVERYINEYSETNNLSSEAKESLTKTINMGLMFKVITKDDIVVEDGRILSMDNIMYDGELFSLNEEQFEKSTSKILREYNKNFKETVVKKHDMHLGGVPAFHETWTKVVNNLETIHLTRRAPKKEKEKEDDEVVIIMEDSPTKEDSHPRRKGTKRDKTIRKKGI